MKNRNTTFQLSSSLVYMLSCVTTIHAASFTSDTFITPADTTYDGQIITVSNCTVTIDGPHTFSSLHIFNGGKVTHSAAPTNGSIHAYDVTGEIQTFNDANPPVLNLPNISTASVVLTDLGNTVTYTQNTDYVLSPTTNGFAQLVRLDGAITNGQTVLLNYSTFVQAGLTLAITNACQIEVGGTINVSGDGFGGGLGTGAGAAKVTSFPYPYIGGAGGGYGGYGGSSSSKAAGGDCYGQITEPVDLGSGGGAGTSTGGTGGGLVRLIVSRSLRVDGQILANGANGTNAHSGGGSGGSIWLSAETLSGTGLISANGGNGETPDGGGGGGGRIALNYDLNIFAGTTTARGGAGSTYGGAGTVYSRINSNTVGQVTLDNGGHAGTNSLLNSTEAFDLSVSGGAISQPLHGNLIVGNLFIRSNAFLVPFTGNPNLVVTINSNSIVEAGGIISADGANLLSQTLGAGGRSLTYPDTGGGGGHGGYGGKSSTNAIGGGAFDSSAQPILAGGNGGLAGLTNATGGLGGGLIRLQVAGDLHVDGNVSASGNAAGFAGGGGGAGGSIWITAGSLSGSGLVSANGGTGALPQGGGGGGGRIALYYTTNKFTGSVLAHGAQGANAGGAGTVYSLLKTEAIAQLLVDNGSLQGTNTLVDLNGFYDLTIVGAGRVDANIRNNVVHNLFIGSDSWMNASYQAGIPKVLAVFGNATIQQGGGILLDGQGSGGGAGPGAGRTSTSILGVVGGGGGYGGYGGSGFLPVAAGGTSFGSILANDQQIGSGGGNGSGTITNNMGGAGGGGLQMTVQGLLTLDGQISANGNRGTGQWSGGGSGGAISLIVGGFSGHGNISANGGAGDMPYGGGGGGGRIAIGWTSNSFGGLITAFGGPGAKGGGAGTVYLNTRANTPTLVVDNGGINGAGTPSPLSLTTTINLTVAGGAQFLLGSQQQSFNSLLIATNASLTWSNTTYLQRIISVSSNAVIQNGGSLSLDGQGSPQGVGLGTIGTGSGGGYGGYGGNSQTNRGGGNSYGNNNEPFDLGSGGGSSFNGMLGGPGGGALRMTVNGTLVIDGSVTANGMSPAPGSGSGGGSGGSLFFTVGIMTGSGSISTDGGAGDLPVGGGGGGGRIAVLYGTNVFSGKLSSRGGAGATYGGAGTIYTTSRQPGLVVPSLLVDNGGNSGTNTPLSVLSAWSLTVSGNARGIVSGSATALSLGNLLIASNSWMGYTSSTVTRTLTVFSNATIQQGGALLADGAGFPLRTGTGAGQTLNNVGGGGGYGGYGGAGGGPGTNVPGGIAFDLASTVLSAGCGGGANGAQTNGGYGGGGLNITVSGILLADGIISANGSAGVGSGSGGGSGGGLIVSAGRLTGKGLISVNGGAGVFPGGGGGGGRLTILYNTNLFTGAVQARGGIGANNGGAGTITYQSINNKLTILTVVDNAGLRGSNTLINSTTLADLTITSGATLSAPFLASLKNLNIASNATLLRLTRAGLTIASNATVQAGGAISADGAGDIGGQGPGPGSSVFNSSFGSAGGGGGHAGFGGSGFSPNPISPRGGITYGTPTGPVLEGSGGGAGGGLGTNVSGGSGGGILRITVNGALTLDGRVSADGKAGIGQWSGGGSGGSVWLTASRFFGAGTISANGGAGDPPYGGGGGGGRIAVFCTTNAFQGSLFARGGGGSTFGGAGTVYLSQLIQNQIQHNQLIVDNGGTIGTNTSIGQLGSLVDVIVSGGAIANPFPNTFIANLTVNSNSWLSVPQTQNLVLSVTDSAVIQKGGGILTDGLGFFSGPGAGQFLSFGSTGGGGGHGGYGGQSVQGAIGGNVYDSLFEPSNFGSGGGSLFANTFSACGGGAIHLIVSNTLSLDGNITANGQNSFTEGAGGGSGGSIWLSVRNISGAGSITANGGEGDYVGGGGGGGRIALYYQSNNFNGSISSVGGAGFMFGGAGSVYSRSTTDPVGSLVVDNGSASGANTPISNVATNSAGNTNVPFHLTILGSAIVNPANTALVVSSLLVDSGGNLTHLNSQSNLDLTVSGDALINSNSFISLDAKGYAGVNGGPGAGLMNPGSSGSGGGYGGQGGASSAGTPGGTTYGSASHPTDRGSRGGVVNPFDQTNFCQGGGSLRMQVGGTLTVNGAISANGNDAFYDRAGGGAGGSIWVSARALGGFGFITANGGQGESPDGGGGGGGRIALYSLANSFLGFVGAFGGYGANWGGNGTVVSTNIGAPQVVAQSPSDVITFSVGSIKLTFDSAINPSTVSASDFVLDTPNGILPQTSLSVSVVTPNMVQLSFPTQTALGYYELQAGPQIQDIYGQNMETVYVGSFILTPPIVSGRVTDTNGQPVAFASLNPIPNLPSVVTDSQGNYSLTLSPGWSGSVSPSKGNALFIPAWRSYTNLNVSVGNQNFVMVPKSALTLTSTLSGGNINLSWYGISGVRYQTWSSTDMVIWQPYGTPLDGANSQITLTVPTGADALRFFRFTTIANLQNPNLPPATRVRYVTPE